MMQLTRYVMATGQIVGTLNVSTTQDAILNDQLIPETDAFINEIWDGDSVYIIDGEVVDRPRIDLPSTHTIYASTDWTIPDVPAGTEVEIDGEVMGVTDETRLTLSFGAPGIWPVTLRPLFPWIAASCEVVVS